MSEHSWLYWNHAIHRAIRFFRGLDYTGDSLKDL